MKIDSVTIFCRAKPGSKNEYLSAAESMGKILAKKYTFNIYMAEQVFD